MKKLFATVAVAVLVGVSGGVALPDSADAQGYRQHRGNPYARGYAYSRPPVVHHRRSNTGRNIAIGVGAAVIGTIIATEAARANSRPQYREQYREPQYYGEERLSCGQLERRCDAGSDWACRQLDRRGEC